MSETRKSSGPSLSSASRGAARLYLYLPLAILGAIVAAYGLLWLQGAKSMRRSVEAWAEDQRENGLAVSYEKISTGGFPFFLRAKVDAVDIADPGRWRWRAERLALDALPYDLNRLIFSPLGEMQFESPDLGAWRASADDIRASIASDDERGWLFSLDVSNGAARRENEAARLAVARLLVDVAPNGADSSIIEASLRAAGLDLDDGARSLSVSLIEAAIGLAQTVAPGDGRDAGGAVLIRQLGIEAAETRLSAAGVIGLDTEGYPAGAVDAQIENPAGVASLLESAGLLTQPESDALATGLALTALATGGTLAAPIVFQDGEARIGGFKLADLPRIQ